MTCLLKASLVIVTIILFGVGLGVVLLKQMKP